MGTPNLTSGRPQPAVIGIDFGSSKCCVAAVHDGRVLVLENEFGQRTTPSCVAFNSQQRLVGGAALDQAVLNSTNTVHAVKRTLGRTYEQVKGLPSECEIRKNYSYPYNIRYWVNYRKKQLQLSPEQITAMLLTKMKDIAESSLGCPVDRAVISVPASYGHAQRVALKTAAEVAGLQVLQLINETTAAGIVFGDNRNVKTPVRIAVVDFGAAKLDISIMEVEGNCVRVIAAAGNPNFGGRDVDEVWLQHCAALIQQQYKISPNSCDKAKIRLRLACEKVKKTLSLLPEARLLIESLADDTDVHIPVYRKDLNRLVKSKIHKEIVETFNGILQEKKISKEAIDRVVLVGGSTRIPVVKSILEEYFGAHKLDQTVNQDEAVAQGAALRATALSGPGKGIEVSDVASFDVYSVLRIEQNRAIFKRYTNIPVMRDVTFHVGNCALRFYQRSKSGDCENDVLICLQYFKVFSRRVIFLTLDINGIFSSSVSSRDRCYGDHRQLFPFYHRDVIGRWTCKEKQFQEDTREEMKLVEAECELESLCFELQSALKDTEILEYLPSEVESIQRTCSSAYDCLKNVASHPTNHINATIKTLRDTKNKVERLKAVAHKKALEEKAARERAEIQTLKEKAARERTEIEKALEDSELLQYSPAEEIKECQEVLNGMKKDELTSLTEVSDEVSHLNRVKCRIGKLKEVSRKKAFEEREAARINNENLKAEIESYLCLLDVITQEFLSSKQVDSKDMELVVEYSFQEIESMKKKLDDMLKLMVEVETTSRDETQKKIDEINCIKAAVEKIQVSVRLGRDNAKKMGVTNENDAKTVRKVFSQTFSIESSQENHHQVDQINHTHDSILPSKNREVRANSSSLSTGLATSLNGKRTRSLSRSQLVNKKEKFNCNRSASPCQVEEVQTGHRSPRFSSINKNDRNFVSPVLGKRCSVEVRKERAENGSACGVAASCPKHSPSCEGEGDNYSPLPSDKKEVRSNNKEQVPSSERGQNSISLRNSSSFTSGGSELDPEAAGCNGQLSLVSVSCLESFIHPDTAVLQTSTCEPVLKSQKSFQENSSLHNEVFTDPSTNILRDSSCMVRDSSETDRDFNEAVKDSSVTFRDPSEMDRDFSETDRDTSETVKDSSETVRDSSETDRDSSETVKDSSETNGGDSMTEQSQFRREGYKIVEQVKGLREFFQYPGLQDWFQKEISGCRTCVILGYVCFDTQARLMRPWKDFIDDMGSKVLMSPSVECGDESKVIPDNHVSVPEVFEKLTESTNHE